MEFFQETISLIALIGVFVGCFLINSYLSDRGHPIMGGIIFFAPFVVAAAWKFFN